MRYGFTAAGLLAMAMGISIAHADVPATQPAAAVTQSAAPDVYLIPFTPLGSDNTLDWAGKAVQQNLLTDLARAKLSVAASDKPIENAADAKTAAKTAGAKFIITGTYQVADSQVRFNGQVLDTATGNVIGGLSATGAPRDLFNMEDALSAQATTAVKATAGYRKQQTRGTTRTRRPARSGCSAGSTGRRAGWNLFQLSGIGTSAVCRFRPHAIHRLQSESPECRGSRHIRLRL